VTGYCVVIGEKPAVHRAGIRLHGDQPVVARGQITPSSAASKSNQPSATNIRRDCSNLRQGSENAIRRPAVVGFDVKIDWRVGAIGVAQCENRVGDGGPGAEGKGISDDHTIVVAAGNNPACCAVGTARTQRGEEGIGGCG